MLGGWQTLHFMAYVRFGTWVFFLMIWKGEFVTIKMVFHLQKEENCENTHIFLHGKENLLMLLSFVSRNIFSIKLVCHILESLVKLNSYFRRSLSAKCIKPIHYSRLKLNVFNNISYSQILWSLRILLLQHLLFLLLFLWELIYFSY